MNASWTPGRARAGAEPHLEAGVLLPPTSIVHQSGVPARRAGKHRGKVAEGNERGWIIPIGGAEEKENSPQILRRFVQLAGAEHADIVVIPTASQLRLSTLIGGTAVAKTVRQLNAAGVPVAGTSAGAAFISEHMIAFGDEGSTPVAGSVRLAPGLGLTNRFIIDQHFRQRDRLGRLLTALAFNPFAIGLGLDDDTAAFIAPDNTVHVQGSGAITVVDAAEVQFSSMDSIDEGHPVCLLGVKLHILTQGATFNLHTRAADAGSLSVAKS